MTSLFPVFPDQLRSELLNSFNEICRNYMERRWEPSELNGGKLCEVVFTIVEGALDGAFPAVATKPPSMLAACRKLEQMPSTAHPADRSLRILIPRTLVSLYEVRNNRGVGHVGGEVNPNAMDAGLVRATASWLMAELVRIFHGVTISEAEAVVEKLSEQTLPFVWEIETIRRVLVPGMPAADQVLLLTYGVLGWVSVDEVEKWTEYKNPSRFRAKVLRSLHEERLLEYDAVKQRVHLTPKGIARVERVLLPQAMPAKAS